MILVDTSIFIESFRSSNDFDLAKVVDLDEIVVCLPVIQEVLQGFDNPRAFSVAREAMFAFPIVEAPIGEEAYRLAIDLYRSARRVGLTVRSSVDCLIGACALRHSLPLLHRDRDFDRIARVSGLEVHRA